MKKDLSDLKIVLVVSLVISILGLSIAYSALSTSLKLSGTAIVNSAKWDIKFVEDTKEPDIVGSATFSKPLFESTSLKNFAVGLTKPGDSISYYFKIKNNGSIDAVLNSFNKENIKCSSSNQGEADYVCSNLEYSITYGNGNRINPGDVLLSGNSTDVKLSLKFSDKATSVPSSNVIVEGLGLSFIYNQK